MHRKEVILSIRAAHRIATAHLSRKCTAKRPQVLEALAGILLLALVVSVAVGRHPGQGSWAAPGLLFGFFQGALEPLHSPHGDEGHPSQSRQQGRCPRRVQAGARVLSGFVGREPRPQQHESRDHRECFPRRRARRFLAWLRARDGRLGAASAWFGHSQSVAWR